MVEGEADELLVLVLANVLYEAVGGEGLAELVGRQAVLGEAEVEEGGDGGGGVAELLLLLGVVGAADEADGALLAEAGEEVEDLGGGGLGRGEEVLAWMGFPGAMRRGISLGKTRAGKEAGD